jgi:septum site-determining protein MinC
MSDQPEGKTITSVTASFEIKSAQLPLVALVLKVVDLQAVVTALAQQFGADSESSEFFDNDPVVIDVSVFGGDAPLVSLEGLLQAVRGCRLVPVALRGAPLAWTGALRSLGLAEAPPEVVRGKAKPVVVQEAEHEPVSQLVREVPGPGTMVIDKPLRSGQKVYARGSDLVLLAMVNQGAEVVADGNIHVYAPLRGKAMAGARGNTQARIFSTCLEPELISIAGVYRTSETPLPKDIAGKPAQVRLSSDGQDKLIIESLKT